MIDPLCSTVDIWFWEMLIVSDVKVKILTQKPIFCYGYCCHAIWAIYINRLLFPLPAFVLRYDINSFLPYGRDMIIIARGKLFYFWLRLCTLSLKKVLTQRYSLGSGSKAKIYNFVSHYLEGTSESWKKYIIIEARPSDVGRQSLPT